MRRIHAMRLVPLALLALVACGSNTGSGTKPPGPAGDPMMKATGIAGGSEDAFGPLEVGADYATYKKLTDKPFKSLDHGNRWVDVYVNAVGLDAYLAGSDIPVGAIVVKTSVQAVDGKPSDIEGPIFVMQKRAKGYAPEHDDWWYAIHWANPPAAEAKKFGGPVYWRGRSPRANYCWKCHDDYANSLGGLVPSSVLPR